MGTVVSRACRAAIRLIALASNPESVGYATFAGTTVGVRAQPISAQQLRRRRLGEQRLVQPVDRRRSAARGQLHQRRRVRDVVELAFSIW
jgi:hypothetical protein